jgi:hypothetical protein
VALLQWAYGVVGWMGNGITAGQADVQSALDALGQWKDQVVGDDPLPSAIAGGVAGTATSAAGDLESASNCEQARLQSAQATADFEANPTGENAGRIARAFAAQIAACGPGEMAPTALYTAGGASLMGPPASFDKGGLDLVSGNPGGRGEGEHDHTSLAQPIG